MQRTTKTKKKSCKKKKLCRATSRALSSTTCRDPPPPQKKLTIFCSRLHLPPLLSCRLRYLSDASLSVYLSLSLSLPLSLLISLSVSLSLSALQHEVCLQQYVARPHSAVPALRPAGRGLLSMLKLCLLSMLKLCLKLFAYGHRLRSNSSNLPAE